MAGLTFSGDGLLQRFSNQLGELGARAPIALARALNHTGTKAKTAVIRNLTQQTGLTKAIMAFTGGAQAGDDTKAASNAATSWAALRRDKAEVASRTIEEIEASGGSWTFAKLTIANAALRELAEAAGKKRR